MDLNALPFDVEAALTGLRAWVACESPTFDAAAVNRAMDAAARDLAVAGASVGRIPGRMGFGDCVRAAFPHPRAGTPGVLVMGHLDTVHPIGSFAAPWARDDEWCYGPGIVDMKGGNCMALEAVRALARAGVPTPLPVTFLLTGDEEVGSPSTRDLIEAEAARQAFVLVPEPAWRNGGVVTGRYAIARFAIETRGVRSHAGAALQDGRSALREMAHRLIEIEAMTSEDCTFSVGVLHAGEWVNCVVDRATAQVLSMAKRQADLDAGVARMLGLAGERDGAVFEVRRGVTRPVWEPDARTMALYATARDLAATIGVDLGHGSEGGGSDGNFTGAMGVPTLDGLGVQGQGIHQTGERMRTESLARRGRLFAGLLATLGS